MTHKSLQKKHFSTCWNFKMTYSQLNYQIISHYLFGVSFWNDCMNHMLNHQSCSIIKNISHINVLLGFCEHHMHSDSIFPTKFQKMLNLWLRKMSKISPSIFHGHLRQNLCHWVSISLKIWIKIFDVKKKSELMWNSIGVHTWWICWSHVFFGASYFVSHEIDFTVLLKNQNE